MVMDAVPYTDADFPLVEAWWKAHNGNEFRKGYISKSAFIVKTDIQPVGFFSMHDMGCDVCYLGYPMVNPDAPKELRESAVDYIIECSKLWAVRTGHPIVFISIRGAKMLSRLEQKGFMSAEEGCKHMFCKVGEIK